MLKPENLKPAHAALVSEVVSHGIDADEVLRLRREVFANGVVDRDEVRLLFCLNEQSAIGNDAAWYEFFVEALTDYFVRQQQPEGYMSDDDAAFLAGLVTHDGRIDDATEFGLLLSILGRLRVAPDALVELALEGVRQTVLGGGTVLFGPNRRRPGVIDEADVELIRQVVFSAGGDGSLTVTRREADLLFDLNHRTTDRRNAPGWRKLFVEAVGHHLMFPSRAPQAPDREEAARRERWLEARRGTGAFLRGMGGAVQDWVKRAVSGDRADAGPAGEAGAPSGPPDAFLRARVDAAEAQWLAARLLEDDRLDDNEVALLAYVKETAPAVDAALDPLFEKAGL